MGAIIGNNCELYPTVSIDSEPYLVKIGNHVRINSGTHLVTHDGACWVVREMVPELAECDLFGKIVIGNNVSIGTNSIIMPGVTIGDNSIVGAGAIVTHNVPPNSVVAGVPAKIIQTHQQKIKKHDSSFLKTKDLKAKKKKEIVSSKFNFD
jgi:acetyltransferase-like isoleucine patch superfamily enzyme